MGKSMENHGEINEKSWKIMEHHGFIENNGKSWGNQWKLMELIMEKHGKFMEK